MVQDPGSDEIVNWGQRTWRYVRREWPKVKAVRGPFLGLLVVGVVAAIGATLVLTRGVYVSDIESLEKDKGSLKTTIESLGATITQQSEFLAQLRHQTKTVSNPQALEKIVKLQGELEKLQAEAGATVSFLGPQSIQQIDGIYVIKGKIHINATPPRSGLTFGFTAKKFQDFKIISATDLPVICDKYELPKLTELGAHRFHCRNVNGAYGFELKIGAAGPVTIRHRLEGKQEGPVVTWQISKP